MAYKIAFFGDDFTGSTDALETLEEMGLDTVLFTGIPTKDQLKTFEDKQAIGVAGMTRTLPTGEIEKELKAVFDLFSKMEIRHVHYKVCSTFDSSPDVGSIGKAIDIGAETFSAHVVPLIVGAPYLGRFCAFGNLFARMGTGQKGEVFRLDRHPSMSKHPVTPAKESDLRRHLAQQTGKKISLVDVTQLEQSAAEIVSQVDEKEEKTTVVLFDVMTEQHLEKIGEVLERLSKQHQPLFSVGSSAVSKALCASWKKTGELLPRVEWPQLKPATPLLVLSGSCAVVTGRQIEHALENGFAEVAVSGEKLLSGSNEMYIVSIAEKVLHDMQQGKSVIVHTSIGPDDTRVEGTRNVLTQQGAGGYEINTRTARLYGKALAQIADHVLQSFVLERLVVAGGDTSSLFAREFGIEAVEMVAPIVPGAPLCRIHAKKAHIHGVTINFKGGQVGDLDYFLRMENGD
ncbi:four-carbon acid sugar kinase family protein [Sphingobacterium chuzhouense]|uniref:Four-carbon acid sugar kinase family protein n=1 Tax=Sphingobacterium chuzhouense TaxID=1742264 RepID=A0ABR7XMZ8_9SPHI|nr:four-carbon acid sugar kinase family protein [Sphingobacterium chuzhouense]MBD1420531.1 four-carbon acid sugar kinase family protein [Sphingobacterium chuzhouense]